MATRWRGTRDLTQGKVNYEDSATTSVITTDYQGPYAQCLAKKPAIGSTIVGFPATHKVTKRHIIELDGDAGKIELTLEAAPDEGSFSTDPLGEPIYEIAWNEVQKSIETHKNCGTLNPDRAYYKDGDVLTVENPAAAGGKQRTWEDWSGFVEATGEDPGGDYLPTSANGDTAWSLAQYQEKKASGQDSFIKFQPVIKRTTVHLAKSADVGNGSGKLQSPPAGANFARVSEFEWLGGPDSCVKSAGKYTRTTEWEGADFWDPQTYPDS